MASRIDREGPIQRSIVAYLRRVMPDALVHHSAGESHLSGKAAMLATVRKKADGMVPGFPDIIVFPSSVVGAFLLEVKAEAGRVSDAQKDVHAQLRGLGYRVAVVRSIEDVRESLFEWGIQTAETGAA